MNTLSILGISLALAMDSFAVSLSGGVCLQRPCWRIFLSTAIVMGVFQAAFFAAGFTLASFIDHWVQTWDHWIAFAILAFVGVHMILEHWRDDEAKVIDLQRKRVLLALGVATSIDAMAVGVGFSILEFDFFRMVTFIALVSFLLSGLGVFLGGRIKNIRQFPAHLVGGTALLGIGLKILIEHMVNHI